MTTKTLRLISCVTALMFVIASNALARAPRTRADARCAGVRPGAHITTSEETGGTLNFLFKDSDGARYAATAGHLLADEATHIWDDGEGPTAQIDDGTVIGRAVYASNFNGQPRDFALIELNRGVDMNPAVCHWGGPTGLHSDTTDEPTVLHLYGNGMGVKEIAPERTLVAARMTNPVHVGAIGIAAPGDSGSPVISDDGRAVGIQYLVGVVWGDLPGTPDFTPGNVAILRLEPQVEDAERALDTRLKLLTAARAN